MTHKELAEQINKRLSAGIKNDSDKKECLDLDEKVRSFISVANDEEFKDFRRRCRGFEAFGMIVEGLKYDAGKEKYVAELLERKRL